MPTVVVILGECVSGAVVPSVVAYLTSRVKRRRSRSWASEAGLHRIRTTPSSGPARLEFLGLSRFLVSAKSFLRWSRRPGSLRKDGLPLGAGALDREGQWAAFI